MSDYAPLLRRLNHWNRKVREAALAEAKALPPDALLELAQQEVKQYDRLLRIMVPLFPVVVLIWITGFVFYISGRIIGHKVDTSLMLLWIYLPLTPLYFIPVHGRWNVAKLLCETDDIRFLGPALDIYCETRLDRYAALRGLILQILPQIRSDQAPLLTPQQRAALPRLLDMTDNPELLHAILKALEQVGDETAISAVEKVARGDFSVRSSMEHRRLREEAERCLPYLKQNAERFQQADTLLRPSSSENAAAPTELLRPVSHSESTPPEQLLRASGGPQAE